MKLRDVLTDKLNKIMLAESDEPDKLIFCGSIREPGSFRVVHKHLGRPVVSTQPSGTYLFIMIEKGD